MSIRRGRKKITNPNYISSRATRLTFKLEPELIRTFKALAIIKNMTIEELGLLALKELFKKEKDFMHRWSIDC